jgi:hypothetical protein
MELRLDRLLSKLREQPGPIFEAIDRDPLLLKRESGPLVLANASQALYTPQYEHQLYAKGIVYRRDPYRLISLPLIKIYNLGERDVTAADLASLAQEPHVRRRFLRKIDGSLIQLFRHDGRAWFTTRGAIEGAPARKGQTNGEDDSAFDYIGVARRIVADRYPRLLERSDWLDGRTLVFELIHPEARKVTNYGDRADLILLAGFDAHRLAYVPHTKLTQLATALDLRIVDALSPAGETLTAQIDSLLDDLVGTDEEGSVVQFERGEDVIYRVKVKSPDYLRRLRAMAECTYERLVALMDANPHLATWADVEAFLKSQGREEMPEELLSFYRPHYERFTTYLADCDCLRCWASRIHDSLSRELADRGREDAAAYRKAFAALANRYPYSALLFSMLDGRLDRARVRRILRDPDEARRALSSVGFSPEARE